MFNAKTFKKLAKENIKLGDKQLNKEFAKKMTDPYYFTDRKLKVVFKTNIDNHHFNHANSTLTFTPNYPKFGIEICYINKIIRELSVFMPD